MKEDLIEEVDDAQFIDHILESICSKYKMYNLNTKEQIMIK